MSKEKSVEIIKGAILLEQRGKSFYQKVASQTTSKAVKEFFENMVVEEESHVEILSEQLKNLKSDGKLKAIKYKENSKETSESVLSENIKKEISGAGYEAAAISAALMMEEKAVAYYTEKAEIAKDNFEKELFEWLSNWEMGHVKLLVAIDKELMESVWNDNQFWPY